MGSSFFSQSCPRWCFQIKPWRCPMFSPIQSSCGEVKTLSSHTSASTQPFPRCIETSVCNLGHYHWAGNWLSHLISVQRVGFFCTSFVLLRGCQSDCRVHQRKYIIVDRRGPTYVGELGNVFKLPISIHIPIWCVMDSPVQWDFEVEILLVLLGLVHNDGWHEALPTSWGKYK